MRQSFLTSLISLVISGASIGLVNPAFAGPIPVIQNSANTANFSAYSSFYAQLINNPAANEAIKVLDNIFDRNVFFNDGGLGREMDILNGDLGGNSFVRGEAYGAQSFWEEYKGTSQYFGFGRDSYRRSLLSLNLVARGLNEVITEAKSRGVSLQELRRRSPSFARAESALRTLMPIVIRAVGE